MSTMHLPVCWASCRWRGPVSPNVFRHHAHLAASRSNRSLRVSCRPRWKRYFIRCHMLCLVHASVRQSPSKALYFEAVSCGRVRGFIALLAYPCRLSRLCSWLLAFSLIEAFWISRLPLVSHWSRALSRASRAHCLAQCGLRAQHTIGV